MQTNGQSQQAVLIAEDEPPLRRVLSKKISELGCQVLTASDGEETLALIAKHHPQIILLDIIMPKKNGFDVLKEIRANHDETTVIIISNLEHPDDKSMGQNYGVKDYILKSNISMRELAAKVKVLLDTDLHKKTA